MDLTRLRIALCLVLLVISTGGVVAVEYYKTTRPAGVHFLGELPDVTIAKRAYIAGAIALPGVYEVGENERVIQLAQRAGGFTPDTDEKFVGEKLNLAAVIVDEQHIFIPARGKTSSAASEGDLLNLNSASLEQLVSLPGVGEATAQKIISARPFARLEDLLEVEGIGESKLNNIRDLVVL